MALLKTIEERISKIEASVLPSDNNDEKFLNVLDEANETLTSFSSKRERFNQIFKKVPALLEYLSPGFIDSISVNTDHKKEVVLSAEDNLRAMSKQFEKIDSLTQYLDSKKILEIPTFESRLSKLEEVHQNQLDKLSESSEDLKILVNTYNQLVSNLSHMFVKWDLILSQIEEKQDK